MVTRSAAPPLRNPLPNGPGSRPPAFVVGLIGNVCGVGSGKYESLPLWCGVSWVEIPLPPSPPSRCAVWWALPFVVWVWWVRVRAAKSWWGRIHGPSRVGSPGGREASLVRQAIFCGRRFCSETLGCLFRCFGRPSRFLLGTMQLWKQYRAIKSVFMTLRPPKIDYTLCHILYTIYSRDYITYYRLYSVYMVYLYTIARPLRGGNQVLHTSLRAMWEPDYSILQHTIV